MTNLKEALPQDSKTTLAIYEHWRREGVAKSWNVNTLGASRLGKCDRALWYEFRHCTRAEFPGRMYRLFDRGNLEEPRVIADLRAIGCEVHEVDEATGKQFRVVALGGHLSGRLDGAVLGVPEAPKTWHVLEIKTHNAKSWRKLQKVGVWEAKPEHYIQMMMYMHLTGMKRALYVAVNKDTEEIYTERIRYDKTEAEVLLRRAEQIIFATVPPPRTSERPDFWQCKLCDARELCHGLAQSALPIPFISCRQCCHATPTLDGNAHWRCELHQKGLSLKEQERACECHLVVPDLIVNAHPVTSYQDPKGRTVIDFEDNTGGAWAHGQEDGAYTTEELRRLPLVMLDNSLLQSLKKTFGAAVQCEPDMISAVYSHSDVRLVWQGRANYDEIAAAWREVFAEEFSEQKPIAVSNQPEYSVAEYHHGRALFVDLQTKQAEIREQHHP